MNIQAGLLATVLCFTIVAARYRAEQDPETDEEKNQEPTRHRRKRYPSRGYGGYSYLPSIPYYHDRYSDRDQDLMPDIWRYLDEISAYVRRPPLPQPIIIYPNACAACNCPGTSPEKPSISNRFPDMDDPNQNWGLLSEEDRSDTEEDTPRPISFEPIKPPRGSRKPPAVEHGSSQAASATTDEDSIPRQCDNAKLSCCYNKLNQRRCFASMHCSAAYADGAGCSGKEVRDALRRFINTYSPKN